MQMSINSVCKTRFLFMLALAVEATRDVRNRYLSGIQMASFEDREKLAWWCESHHTLKSAHSMSTEHADLPTLLRVMPLACLEDREEADFVFNKSIARWCFTSISQI